jgi:hypothetical protein
MLNIKIQISNEDQNELILRIPGFAKLWPLSFRFHLNFEL